MAKIFYSMAGEGRGHATRVRAVVEMLRHEHEITLFAPAAAYALLSATYQGTGVRVRQIPGLLFHYRKSRIDCRRTATEAVRYLSRLPQMVDSLVRHLRSERPDLVITDFEPALPRAAKRCGIPFISLDHQHFLVVNDLSALPLKLRIHARLMAAVVRAYCSGQVETIVSSFYFPPLKPGFEGVVQSGIVFRPEVLDATLEAGDHLLVYLKPHAAPHVLDTLRSSGIETRIYGLGTRPDKDNLRFRAISETGFLADLTSCRALIATAGNQLLGEALYLRKPVLALPESRHFEQIINSHFLRTGGGGDWLNAADFNPGRLQGFLDRADEYRGGVDRDRLKGNDVVLQTIRRHLPRAARPHKGPVRWDLAVPSVAG